MVNWFSYSRRKKTWEAPNAKALLDRIVKASSNPEMVVLDPFCGSGTTGVAALLNGRKFIGIDAEVEYLKNIAFPRLTDAEQAFKSRIL